MSGAIAQRANETSKALGGKVSYLLGDVRRVRRLVGGRDAAHGRRRDPQRARCSTSIVANGRYLGGGMKMCPDADARTTASSTCSRSAT